MSDPVQASPTPSDAARRCVPIGRSLLGSFSLHLCLLGSLVLLAAKDFGSESNEEIQIAGEYRGSVAESPTVEFEAVPTLPGNMNVTRQQIEDTILRTQDLAPEVQQNQLDVLSIELARVSTSESVSEICNALTSVLGLEPVRSESQSEPPTGEFDSESGQIYDVQRRELPEGGQCYVCILMDAEGRSMELELDGIDGPQLFAIMEKIKANPLLEQVYRNLAIPLLQQKLGGLQVDR